MPNSVNTSASCGRSTFSPINGSQPTQMYTMPAIRGTMLPFIAPRTVHIIDAAYSAEKSKSIAMPFFLLLRTFPA